MPTEWSDNILISQLADEPALSDELQAVIGSVDAREPTPHVVLDFSGVSYLNSSNIAQMLRIRQALEDAGRSLRIAGMNNEVWSIMQVTGLDKIFRFAPDTMTALAGLQIESESAAGGPDEAEG